MKKITLIAMTLVLALGLAGVGYALWSDSLYLEGTVNTGTIGLKWTNDLQPYDDELKGEVSWAESLVSADGKTFTITIHNAYPCVTYYIPWDLHGIGSVPVHTSFELIQTDMDPLWIFVPDLTGMQIHQGQTFAGEITIHLDNTAVQGHVYTATYELVYWQYNELGPSGQP